jgi:hypothetical protein
MRKTVSCYYYLFPCSYFRLAAIALAVVILKCYLLLVESSKYQEKHVRSNPQNLAQIGVFPSFIFNYFICSTGTTS